jgi:hypothetical protein
MVHRLFLPLVPGNAFLAEAVVRRVKRAFNKPC